MCKVSDYRKRRSAALSIAVSDSSGVLHAVLIDTDEVASIIFGAGDGSDANSITGTIGIVDAVDLIYAANVLTFKVEVTAAQTANAKAHDDYEYHIKAIAPVESGETLADEVVRISGCLDLRNERAQP